MNAPPGPFRPFGPPPPHPYAPNPHAPNPYAPNPYAPNPYAPNPYGPPQVLGALDPNAARPARLDAALYAPNLVGLATFLGTPLGGAAIMAMNEHRVGRTSAAIKTLLAGLAGTALLLTLAVVLPANIPTFPVGIGSLVLMGAIAKSRQSAFVQQHFLAGGRRGSGWAAAGIGLLSLMIVFVPLVAVLVLAEIVKGR